jgi:NADPH-dependent 2,4-dienoyl-CoA reductase/sulfur reductase-like enzyme
MPAAATTAWGRSFDEVCKAAQVAAAATETGVGDRGGASAAGRRERPGRAIVPPQRLIADTDTDDAARWRLDPAARVQQRRSSGGSSPAAKAAVKAAEWWRDQRVQVGQRQAEVAIRRRLANGALTPAIYAPGSHPDVVRDPAGGGGGGGESGVQRPRVCVVGAGAAGLAAARQLFNAGADVTLVPSPRESDLED